MKISDLTEQYGMTSGGPTYGSSMPAATSKPTTSTTSTKTTPANAAKKIPLRAPEVAPINTADDLMPENPTDPVQKGVYDKSGKLVSIYSKPKGTKPGVFLDPRSRRAMVNLRGLHVDATQQESAIAKFVGLPLEEQLRIVENLSVERLDKILNGKQ